jgi:hypothetical protein
LHTGKLCAYSFSCFSQFSRNLLLCTIYEELPFNYQELICILMGALIALKLRVPYEGE